MNFRFLPLFFLFLLLLTGFQTSLRGEGAPSLSTAADEIIPTQTIISANPSEGSVYGQPVAFVIKVVPTYVPAVLPSGFVQIYVDDQAAGKVPLVNNLATYATSSIPASLMKRRHIKAVYLGDQHYATSTDVLEFSVLPVSTKVELSSKINPATWGQTLAIDARVSSFSPGTLTPQGKLQFYRDDTLLKEADLDVDGDASWTNADSAVGSHEITAIYKGNDNFRESSSKLTQKIGKAPSRTEITSSKSPAVYGQEIEIKAAIASQLENKIPSGQVQFEVDGKSDEEQPLSIDAKGQAKISFRDLAVGSHKVEALYLGDDKFKESKSYLIQEINKAATRMSVAASKNPTIYGSAVTFTAEVQSDYTTPAGLVQFMINERLISTKKVDPEGKAAITLADIDAGDNAVVVNYLEDSNFKGSSANLTQQIKKAETTASLTSSINPSVYGSDIPFEVIVTAQDAIPDGSVEFQLDGVVVSVGKLDSGGKILFTTSNLAAGEHKASMRFLETMNFKQSEASVTQSVKKQDVKITLISSKNPSEHGAPVIFTAQVGTQGGIPTGFFQFNVDAAEIEKKQINSDLQASYTAEHLAAGEHKIQVSYSGDPNINDTAVEIIQKVTEPIKKVFDESTDKSIIELN